MEASASMPEIGEMERQMGTLTERTLELKHIIHGLEMEILQWSTGLKIDEEYLHHLESHKISLDVVLRKIAKILPSRLLVPSEVWVRIFKYWVRDRDSVLVHHALPSPLVLGHVCRLWRNVVFSAPDLWTRLDICPPLMWSEGHLAMLRIVQRAAERSTTARDMQLELFLDQTPPKPSQSLDTQYDWSRFYFGPTLLHPFQRLRIHVGLTTDFSELKFFWGQNIVALAIRGTRAGPPVALRELINHFRGHHELIEELELNCIRHITPQNLSALNIRQLRISVDTSTPLHLFPFLQPSLESLYIQYSSSSLSLSGSSPDMRHLKHLTTTPHQYSMIYGLIGLNLDTLTLLPPTELPSSFGKFLFKSRQEPTDPVVDLLVVALSYKLQRVEILKFAEWKSTSKPFSCVYALERCLKQGPTPSYVGFEACRLDGLGIVSLFRSLDQEKRVLVELTLTSCTGVTRAQGPVQSAGVSSRKATCIRLV